MLAADAEAVAEALADALDLGAELAGVPAAGADAVGAFGLPVSPVLADAAPADALPEALAEALGLGALAAALAEALGLGALAPALAEALGLAFGSPVVGAEAVALPDAAALAEWAEPAPAAAAGGVVGGFLASAPSAPALANTSAAVSIIFMESPVSFLYACRTAAYRA